MNTAQPMVRPMTQHRYSVDSLSLKLPKLPPPPTDKLEGLGLSVWGNPEPGPAAPMQGREHPHPVRPSSRRREVVAVASLDKGHVAQGALVSGERAYP